MTTTTTSTQTGSESFHERNTDHGTHTLIASILDRGFIPQDPTAYSGGRSLIAPLDSIRDKLLPAFKSLAEEIAQQVAGRALARLQEAGRWTDTPTLAHAFAEVFFDAQVRRGSVPSPAGRADRRDMIEAALGTREDLRFSVLILPRRDTNPAKNDGPSPDIGEVSTLLRLWIIGRSLELVRSSFTAPCISVIEATAQTSGLSPAAAREFLDTVISRTADSLENRMAGLEIASQAISTARKGKETLTRTLTALGGELAGYQVHNRDNAASLLLALARAGRSVEWLEAGLKYTDHQKIEILAIQDSRRYACCRTDPMVNIAHYRDVLAEIASCLAIDDHVTLTSHEELEAQQPPERLAEFLRLRSAVFQAKLSEFMARFEPIKELIMAATSREEVLALVEANDLSGKVTPLFEAILHTRYHPALEEWSASMGSDPRAFRVEFIKAIYEPRKMPELENLRRCVLWETVVGSAEYVASYDSNSAAANEYGLDDVGFLAPGSIRLSIHKKGEHCRQFTIQPGPSIHRTPWHGTAALRLSSKGGGLSLDCRLGLELKHEGFVPLFLSKHSENRNDNRELGPVCRVTNREEWLRFGSLLETAQNEQPFVWLSPELVASLAAEGYTDVEDIIAELARRKIKF